MSYLLFGLIGITVGVVTGLFFFRIDKQWVKYLTVTGGNAGVLAGFSYTLKVFEIPSADRLPLATAYIACAIGSAFITVYLLLRFLKQEIQDDDIKFRILDVLLGHQQAINKYYEARQKLIDKKLNIKDLTEKKKDLAAQEKRVRNEQETLEATKLEAEALLKQCICLSLPVDKTIPVDPVFISLIPSLTENVINFSVRLAILTEGFKSKADKSENSTLLLGYLLAVCSYTAVYLFDSNTVRVHIRFLDPITKEYKKLVASVGESTVSEQMTPIPLNEGLIYHAITSKRSVIKSLNPDLHLKAKHDHIWQDYIAMTFDDERLCVEDKPLLSMGISVKSSENFKYLMRFLSHCHIEQIVQRHILTFDEKVPIVETLKGGEAKWLKSA